MEAIGVGIMVGGWLAAGLLYGIARWARKTGEKGFQTKEERPGEAMKEEIQVQWRG